MKKAAVKNRVWWTAVLPVPVHPKEPASGLYNEDRRGSRLYSVLAGC